MTSNHNYFESLCALAISHELTGLELAELHQHSLQCISCRNRIHEMAKIDVCLLLSPAFTRRNERLPKGMRERFITRAIKEGVPLNSPSTAGLGNLGLASALFIILLATAASIRTGPFSRPVVDARHFDGAQVANPVHATSLTPTAPPMGLLPGRRDRSRGASSTNVLVQWRLYPSPASRARKAGALPDRPGTFQNRYVPAPFSSPRYTLATMSSDVGRLSSWPYMPSTFRLATSPIPVDTEHASASPLIISSEFTFAALGTDSFHPALHNDPHRSHRIFALGETPLKFHFVENVTQ